MATNLTKEQYNFLRVNVGLSFDEVKTWQTGKTSGQISEGIKEFEKPQPQPVKQTGFQKVLSTAEKIAKPGIFALDVGKQILEGSIQSVLAPTEMIREGLGKEPITPEFVGGSLLKEIRRKQEAAAGSAIEKGFFNLETLDLGLSLIKPIDLIDVYGASLAKGALSKASAKKIAQIQAKKVLFKKAQEEAAELAAKRKFTSQIRTGVEKRGKVIDLSVPKPDLNLRPTTIKQELLKIQDEIYNLETNGVSNSKLIDIRRGKGSKNVLNLRGDSIRESIKQSEKRLNSLLKKEEELKKKLLKETYNVNKNVIDSVYNPPKKFTKATLKLTDDITEQLDSLASPDAERSLMRQGVKEEETGIKKVYNNHLVSMINVFNKMGNAGRLMTRKIFRVSDNSAIKAGEAVADYENLIKSALKSSGLSKKELGQHISDVLENGIKPMDDAVEELTNFIYSTNKVIANDAKALNVKMKLPGSKEIIDFKELENFFPHMYDLNKIIKIFKKGGKKKNEFLQKIADANDSTLTEAEEIWNKYMITNSKRFVGNLQHARRFNVPGYRTDLKALADYWGNAFHRLEEIREFGNFDEIADAAIKRIGDEGGDAEFARKMWQRITGQDIEDKILETFWSKVRGFNAITLLDTTAITQLAQLSPAMTKFGIFRTLTNLIKVAWSPSKYKNYALRHGTLLDVTNELAMTKGNLTSLYLNRISGIGFVDNFMRSVTTQSAIPYVRETARKLIANPTNKKLLRDFGKIKSIDINKIIKRGHITKQEEDLAIKYLVDLTQVRARQFELPISWTSETGKTITQLKTFTFSFQRYITEEIIKEARHGNFIPMIRLGILSQATGEVIGDLKALALNRERPEGFVRVMENWGYGLTLGYMYEIMKSAEYGAGAVTAGLAGVTASTFGEAIANLYLLIAKQNPDPILKMIIRRLPLVGSSIKGFTFPKK